MDSASADRTTIVIAHRLSTIRNADLIVVMNHGELVERGTHQELLLLDGIYADLVKKQEVALNQECATGEKVEKFTIDEDAELVAKLEANKHLEVYTHELGESTSFDSNGETLHKKSGVTLKLEEAGVDAYQLKIQQQKEEKKRVKSQKAPVSRVIWQMNPEWPRIALGVAGAAIAGAVFPVFAFVFSKVITTILVPGSNLDPGPMKGVNLYAFMFVVIGIFAFIGFSTQVISFEVAGEEYSKRLRAILFRQYMKQEVGYFDQDDNHTGALTAKLAVDAKNVNEMITKVWGNVTQVSVTAIVGR